MNFQSVSVQKIVAIVMWIIILLGQKAFGQFSTSSGHTTTFDNVGIGLTSPTSSLDILTGYYILGGSGSPCTYSGQPGITIRWESPDPLVNPLCGSYTNGPHNVFQILDYPDNTAGGYPMLVLNRFGQMGIKMDPLTSVGAFLNVNGNSFVQGNSQTTAKLRIGNTVPITTGNWSSNPYRLYVDSGDAKFNGNISVLGTCRVAGKDTIDGDAKFYGQVSIGTLAPGSPYSASYKLGVDGDIVCKKAIVTIYYWADDVFSPNYYLRPLEDVATFVNKEKHLPGVPSEREVIANGISLGEMDAILLRKIEELTLYLFALKQENAEIKRQLVKTE